MRLDQKARSGLVWLVLAVGVVAVLWTIGAANPAFGFFLPGCATLLWLALAGMWWSAWYTRVNDKHTAIAKHQREVAYRAAGLDQIDTMSGVEFEHYVAAVLRGLGYQTSLTKATGDFGVDIVASKGGTRTAVQCKRQGNPVGGAAVQQAVAGAAMHQCTATMVVCNQTFTRAAQALAQAHDCRLIDRAELESLALRSANADRVAAPRTTTVASASDKANGSLARGLLPAAGVSVVVVAICGGVALSSTASRQEEAAEQLAAASSAPCPRPMSDLLNTPESLVTLPDVVGDNAEDVRIMLKQRGITEINWKSANPRYEFVVNPSNWTVVSTSPRAGCAIGPSDRPTITVTK